MRPQLAQEFMRPGQILAARAFALVKIWNGIEAQTIDAHVQPKVANFFHCFVHGRIVEIQIRLVRIKAMPVICFCDRVPRPIGSFEIFEDDARIFIFFRRVAPNVEVFVVKVAAVAGVGDPGRPGRRFFAAGITNPGYSYSTARFLEPRILV